MADSLEKLVEQFQKIMAHAWMVRTFVKHSEEVEDYPDLMEIVRAVFDMSRAIESKAVNPAEYFRFAGKKIGRLKKASQQFQQDAWKASTHTNFHQAVVSIQAAVEQMESILEQVAQLRNQNSAPDVQITEGPDEG